MRALLLQTRVGAVVQKRYFTAAFFYSIILYTKYGLYTIIYNLKILWRYKRDKPPRLRRGGRGVEASIQINAYAKINLGLDVLRRREDGYHELRMGMQTVSLCDTLTLTKKEDAGIVLRCDRAGLPTDRRNLAVRAAEALFTEAERRGVRPMGGVEIWLSKRIPAAAGLAGGSADAAAMLRGLNTLYGLGFSEEALQAVGLPLGADIPYCVTGGTALAEGIGERLTPLPALPACCIVVAKPSFDLSAAYIYANLRIDSVGAAGHPDMDGVISALRRRDLRALGQVMGNILELPAKKEHPEIERLKKSLREAGAEAASMSGSGSAVFGLFENEEQAKRCAEQLLSDKALALEGVYLTTPVYAPL